MAMATAMLVALPPARSIMNASFSLSAERLGGVGSSSWNGSGGMIHASRCSSDLRAPESRSGRGGAASCCAGISRASGIVRNVQFGSSSSGLIGLDERISVARRSRIVPRKVAYRISAEKTDLSNVAGTLYKLGKQGLDAGTKLVPETVPRPVAQAGVGLAGVLLASFLLRSLFSTLSFILAIGALSYAGYFFLNKGESSSSSGSSFDSGSSGKPKSTDEALEEARKIMEKYK